MSERREFLERSLADLDDEHDAGDLSDEDHARLRAEYEERLAILDGRRRPPAGDRRPRPSWHRWATWGGVAAFALTRTASPTPVAEPTTSNEPSPSPTPCRRRRSGGRHRTPRRS